MQDFKMWQLEMVLNLESYLNNARLSSDDSSVQQLVYKIIT